MSAPSYIIIGCGHFGSRAAKQLLKKRSHPKIIAVDKSPEAMKTLSHLSIVPVVDDGLSYLNRFLWEGKPASYIIPSVPFHLAFEFILLRLRPLGAKRAKVPPFSGLPNPVKGKKGDLYTSLADFLCPEDCPGPARYCTVTGKEREQPLYQILKDLKGPFESRIVISKQLLPGVGGYQLGALLALLEEVKRLKNLGRLILISTASRCHAVTSALRFSSSAHQ
ncbi:MAG: NAD-binding protein [Thermodesulfobacteriota bacterium]